MESKIGERIKYFRVKKGLSQEKLALISGLNPAFIGHLERGLKSPTITTLDKIIEALNVTYAEFFSDIDYKKSTEDYDNNSEFYLNMVNVCLKRLPKDKIKNIADIILNLVELLE